MIYCRCFQFITLVWWDMTPVRGVWWDLTPARGVWWDLTPARGVWWDLTPARGVTTFYFYPCLELTFRLRSGSRTPARGSETRSNDAEMRRVRPTCVACWASVGFF